MKAEELKQTQTQSNNNQRITYLQLQESKESPFYLIYTNRRRLMDQWMERSRYCCNTRPVICAVVVLLGLIAFSCSLAAEFRKVKDKDMRLDGSLCSMPRRPAFGLGIAALVFLSVAQIAGTSAAATSLCGGKRDSRRNKAVSITLLVLSWISFSLAAILLGTASSMNNRQTYGRGWTNGKCYVVKDGIFVGAAVLSVATVLLVAGFTYTTRDMSPRRTGPLDERINHQQQQQQQQQNKEFAGTALPQSSPGLVASDANL